MSLVLRETSNNPNDGPATGDYQDHRKQLVAHDASKLDPQELGKVIVALQEEIKIIKAQLENLPGYARGEVPPHLIKLRNDLEKTFQSLEQKNEILINSMTKNFGQTQQNLPNFRLPEVQTQEGKKPSLYEVQTDTNGDQPLFTANDLNIRGRGDKILKKTVTQAEGTYQAKRGNQAQNKRRPKQYNEMFDSMADPPPITEDDINKGMINLLNKGVIPKDVDLTPAFEKGAAPVQCKGIRFYEKKEQYVKRETMTGATHQNTIRFDLQPIEAPKYGSGRTARMQKSIASVEYQGNQLALPAPGDYNTSQQQLMVYDQSQRADLSIDNLENSNMKETPALPAPDATSNAIDPNARDYNELMDVYSLHNLMVRNGKVIEQTPEFISFKRTFISRWGSISYVLLLVEKLLGSNNIELAYIDGHKIAKLAEDDLKKPSHEQLFDCIIDKEQYRNQVKIPSLMFKGQEGPILAATTVQKYWRMHKARVAYTYLKFLMVKATTIQRQFRLYLFQKQTKTRVEEITNESLFVWKEMMDEFKNKWPAIKKRRRVEIHINSLSIDEIKRVSMEKFLQRENSQISRIFSVKDPNVDVIYVSPFQMTNDVLGYYMKILEIGEVESVTNRVTFVVPDNIDKFPHHLSLTQALIYSPKTINRIKSMIKGKQSYIVPGVASTDDIKLSIKLGIPIMSGEPQKQHLYSTKSGAKKIFQLADVPTPISAEDIYDEQDFLLSLSKLISQNLYVNTWLFKIDDEFQGRGHAYITVDQIKPLQALRRKQTAVGEGLVEQIMEILNKHLPKKATIPVKTLYSGWPEFLESFCRVGGVIEAVPTCLSTQMASPSIAFLIEPDGQIELIGSFDKFSAKEYVNAGCFYPQQSLPNMNLMTICQSIGDILYEKGVLGHITVDLVSFPDPTSPNAHPLFWAIDLNCSLSDYGAACYFFDFLMEGNLDQFTGRYVINNSPDEISQRSRQSSRMNDMESNNSPYKQHQSMGLGGNSMSQYSSKQYGRNKDFSEPRCFMYCRYLHHPGISKIQYKTFFHMCRLQSISFDLEQRKGSTFMLQDCLQSGLLAMLTIGEERKDTLHAMCDAFKFIEQMAGNVGLLQRQAIGNNLDESRSDKLDVADVMSAIRLIQKTFLKKEDREKQKRQNRIQGSI